MTKLPGSLVDYVEHSEALGAARQIEPQTAIHAVYTLMIEMVTHQPQTGVDLPEPGSWRLLEGSLDHFDHAHASP